jgi:hypothetical protein
MAVDVDCYLEALTDGRWRFDGEIVPNPDHEYDREAPASMPRRLFWSFQKELAAILTGSGNPIRSAEWMRDGVVVEWLESYAEIVPDFCAEVLPRLAAAGDPDGVRLVVTASW